MIEALGFAVSDGAVGKQRRIAAPASIEQSLHAANIEERFLLAGEACVRQILRRRARAHRDIRIDLARPAAELLVRLGDGSGEFIKPRAVQKGVPNRRACFCKRDLAGFEIVQRTGNDAAQFVCIHEPPTSVRRRGESGRHLHALSGQMAHHLAERRVFAADDCNVAAPKRFEPHDRRRGRNHRGLLFRSVARS